MFSKFLFLLCFLIILKFKTKQNKKNSDNKLDERCVTIDH